MPPVAGASPRCRPNRCAWCWTGIGHIKTKTHDYVGQATLTLFAALNYLNGKLITRIANRHRHQEWLAFLKTSIDRQTPCDLDIPLIADNYLTHRVKTSCARSRRHGRCRLLWRPQRVKPFTRRYWLDYVGNLTPAPAGARSIVPRANPCIKAAMQAILGGQPPRGVPGRACVVGDEG
jgi:hypothetical protein